MNNGSIRKKRINPTGADGNIRRCKSCDSMRHMLPEWNGMEFFGLDSRLLCLADRHSMAGQRTSRVR